MATDPEGEKEFLYIKTKYLTPSQGERERKRERRDYGSTSAEESRDLLNHTYWFRPHPLIIKSHPQQRWRKA